MIINQTGRLVVFATGGTIASEPGPCQEGVTVRSSGLALLAEVDVPDLADVALQVIDFAGVGSFALEMSTSFRLASEIATVLDEEDVIGVVVTHGTDTLEETAFLIDLTVASDKPVVVTGAQRSREQPDADGSRNLRSAMRVAVSPKARGLGTLVVFAEEIHAARDVTKTHTSDLGTFKSPSYGPLGFVDDDRVVVRRHPAKRICFRPNRINERVDLIKLAMGSDGRFIDYAVKSGAQAIVIEAFGRGNATPSVLKAVQRARGNDIPVVICSRCPAGSVRPIYGHSGGAALSKEGALFANISAAKARILLAVLLGERETRESLPELLSSILE